MRRAIGLALVCLLPFAGGCASSSRGPTPAGGSKTAGRKPAGDAAPALAPAPSQLIGHVLSIDMRTLTVVVDVSPFARLPSSLTGQVLLTRTDDLTPTGQVQASAHFRGRTLGARLLTGRPRLGDEVVILPAPSP